MVNVVKIGGNIVDNPDALRRFLDDFASLAGPKVLIHGGGKEATRLCQALSIETRMVEGRRITDRPTLDVVTMVYAGLINKRIVAMLQARGCNAIGLSGADENLIPATRRPSEPVDFGFVGDIDPAMINSVFLSALLSEGSTPVICAICHDGKGSLLNCNADSVAGNVARALAKTMPVAMSFCFEKPGVLADPDDDGSVIATISSARFDEMRRSGAVAKGMVPKLQNALSCCADGVEHVRICDASALLRHDAGTSVTI